MQGLETTLTLRKRTWLPQRCVYLSEDGTTLMDEPQYIWRMQPWMKLRGRSAGMVSTQAAPGMAKSAEWIAASHPIRKPRSGRQTNPPVYFWTANAYDDEDAYYVSYTGFVSHQPKTWGNPRHGYRCVREL